MVAFRSKLLIFNAETELLKSFGSEGSSKGQFRNIGGITVTQEGNILVSDEPTNRIQIFDALGHFMGSVSHQLLKQPYALVRSPAQSLYISSSSGSIYKFN